MMIAACLIKTNPIVVQKELAAVIGLEEAIFLQQLQFWAEVAESEHTKMEGWIDEDGNRWIYNTAEQWASSDNFPFWSARKIGRLINNLEDDGYILSQKVRKSQSIQTKYYRINHEKLAAEVDPKIDQMIRENVAAKRKKQIENSRNGPQVIDSNHMSKLSDRSDKIDRSNCQNCQISTETTNKESSTSLASEIQQADNPPINHRQRYRNETEIPEDWHPDDITLDKIEASGTPREFALWCLAEFLDYWVGSGEVRYWPKTFTSSVMRSWLKLGAMWRKHQDEMKSIGATIECPIPEEVVKAWNRVMPSVMRSNVKASVIPGVTLDRINEAWTYVNQFKNPSLLTGGFFEEVFKRVAKDTTYMSERYNLSLHKALAPSIFQTTIQKSFSSKEQAA